MLNDTSRFVVHARDSAFASLGASISPYVVNNTFDQSNFDIEVDGGQIYVGFTSTLNSSMALGNSDIVISQYNMSYHLQSSLIVSTTQFDSLNRLLPLSGNKLMVVGMTEGDLSNPMSTTGSRKAFVAHFQYFWISSLSNASPGYVRGGESFLIMFSSLPSSASLSTPSVTLNGRMCTVQGWVGQNLNVTAPYGIGGPHELRIVFSYLPFTPTVINRTLSYPPPVLQSINVTQGPAVGYPIGLNVSNLGLIGQDTVTVTVAGQQCRNMTQINSLQLTCVTPPGTGVDHRVVVSAGINFNSTEVLNISYDSPTFYQIAPNSGPTIGGNDIALHGKNFGPCALMPCNSTIHKVSISIAGLPCSNPLLWNDSLVRCLPPPGVGVGHSIVVVVDGQQGVNDSVTYAYDIPKIALLVPSTSLSTSPTVYIEGENFGFNLTMVEVLFIETVNATVYTCENLLLKSNNNIRCDFSSMQLPNDATFNITVMVANQYSTITSKTKFRTGVANSSPTVHPYNETLNEDSTLVIVLQGDDPDPGDFITFFVSSTTTHGNLYQFSSSALNSQGPIIDTSLSPVAIQDPLARLVYIPFNEFSGIDSFTFLGRDGSNAGAWLVILISILR
ncbi:hypothetical protein BKA69DRAFT_928822 [Paraphysoderma sedebokerense]|nr:hypothetical protein BKA69DRAFT_928822 [Paraphysoderma sedebokerense]